MNFESFGPMIIDRLTESYFQSEKQKICFVCPRREDDEVLSHTNSY